MKRKIVIMEIAKEDGTIWNQFKKTELTVTLKELSVERILISIYDLEEEGYKPMFMVMHELTKKYLLAHMEMTSTVGIVNKYGGESLIAGIPIKESKICPTGEVYFY